jgi:hypothetical protein
LSDNRPSAGEIHSELSDVALVRDGGRGCSILADHVEVNIARIEHNGQRDRALLEMLAPT